MPSRRETHPSPDIAELTLCPSDPYGSTESTRVDGELVSALVTWDSKITTVVALLGGVGDLVRDKLKKDGKYNEFISITEVRDPLFLRVANAPSRG